MLIYINLCGLYLANEWNAFINSQNDIVKSSKNLTTYKKKIPPIVFYEKVGLLQLVSEHLVWILRIINNSVVVINLRMVRTRQVTRTKPPPWKEGRKVEIPKIG